MRDIWRERVSWRRCRQPLTLARVIRTWGASPRAPGAAMLIGAGPRVAGSVSGGFIEAGHITIPLVELARPLGFHPVVVDPRGVFASPDRFVPPGELLGAADG